MRWKIFAGAAALSALAGGHAAAEEVDRATLTGLDASAYDLLNNRCGDCHSEFMFQSDFEAILDFEAMFANTLAPGQGRFAINCADPARSNILNLTRTGSDGAAPKMPRDGAPLSEGEITLLNEWIVQGCDARSGAVTAVVEATPAQTPTTKPVEPPSAVAPPAAAPIPIAGDIDLAAAAEQALTIHCARCHTSGGRNNGGFIHVADLGWLARGLGPKPYVDACRPDQSLILRQIENGAMPRDGSIHRSAAHAQDIAAIRDWIYSLDGEIQRETLREGREFVRAETIRQAALLDASRAGFDAANYRYFSLANLYNSNASDAELEMARRGLGKLINMLSYGPRVIAPQEVKNTNGLLLRIELRDYGWDAAKWELLERAYEYGVEPFESGTLEQLSNATGARIPILRGDWFAFKASRPPLYHDLLNLPTTEQELERQLGLDTLANIRSDQAVRAGFGAGESGVSFNARLIERHDLPRGGMYWKSYDFGGRNREQNLEETPFGPIPPTAAPNARLFEHDGGEVIFSLPNGLHGYYLATADGQRIDVGPPEIVHDSSRDDRQIVNGLSCMSCHSGGVQIKEDSIRADLLGETGASRLTPREREAFRRLHPEPEELLDLFRRDEQAFMAALQPLKLSEPGEGGLLKPVLAADGIEPVRALSDRYEEGLSLLRLAAEMDMTLEEFEAVAVGNAAAKYVRRPPCDRTERETYQAEFAELLPVLTPHRRLEARGGVVYEAADPAPSTQSVGAPINVAVELPRTNFRIGDLFHFHVTAGRDCHFLIFTIDQTGKVEVHDPSEPANRVFMGSPTLRAGERRRIPISEQFAARVDPPAGRQRIGAVCGVNELTAMGIHDYTLRRPAALGEDKFSFVVQETTERFDSTELDAALVDIQVTE